MRYLTLVTSIVVMMCVLSQNLLGDWIYLKDGGVFQGVVTEKGKKVLIELPKGISILLNRRDIEKIEKEKIPKEESSQPEEKVSDPDEVGPLAKKSASTECKEARRFLLSKYSGRAIRKLNWLLQNIKPSEAKECCEILKPSRDTSKKILRSLKKAMIMGDVKKITSNARKWLCSPVHMIGQNDIDTTRTTLQQYSALLKSVTKEVKDSCSYCYGVGAWKCNRCDGKGWKKKKITKVKTNKVKCSTCKGKGKGKCTGQDPYKVTSLKTELKGWHAAQKSVEDMGGLEKMTDGQMEVDEQLSALKNIKTMFRQIRGGRTPVESLVELCTDNKFYYMAFQALAKSGTDNK